MYMYTCTCTHVRISRENSENWGALGLYPLGWEAWLNLRNTFLSHICYLAERDRSALSGAVINREPQQLGSVGSQPSCSGDMDPRKCAPHNTCYPADFGLSTSNSASINKEIPLKKNDPRIPHFKVAEGYQNRLRSISYL